MGDWDGGIENYHIGEGVYVGEHKSNFTWVFLKDIVDISILYL